MSAPNIPERPLERIRREAKAADRHPHLRRANQARPDRIDTLDDVVPGGAAAPYHHGGPFDAALAVRNRDPRTAPLAAVERGNREALRATPRANIVDALTRHVPLQGTASVPPGCPDYEGHVMRYDEGDDLMRDADAGGGPYRRYEHVQYHPDDLKGKGEPSYTIERDLKAGKGKKKKSKQSKKGKGIRLE